MHATVLKNGCSTCLNLEGSRYMSVLEDVRYKNLVEADLDAGLEAAFVEPAAAIKWTESTPVVRTWDGVRRAAGKLVTTSGVYIVRPDDELRRKFSEAMDPGCAAFEQAVKEVAPQYDWHTNQKSTHHGGAERDEGLRLPPFSDWYRVRLDYLETNPGHGDFEAILARTKKNGKAGLTREELRNLEPSLESGLDKSDVDDDLAQRIRQNIFRSLFRRVCFEDGIGGGIVHTTISPASRQLCGVRTLAGRRVTRQYAILGE